MQKEFQKLEEDLEEYLHHLFPAQMYFDWWNQYSGAINAEQWREEWQESGQNLIDPLRTLLLRGGKRWRPIVMLLSGLSLNLKKDDLLPLASILEIAHNASLIVDDIEDNATLRRGEMALHLVYGEDNAINSANFAYFSPLVVLDKLDVDAMTKIKLYQIWHQGMRRVHMGQALDISWHNSDLIPTDDEYKTMAKLKTGSLLLMGLEFVLALTDRWDQEQGSWQEIWLNIGLAFQILDDAHNLLHGVKGKEQADDLLEGKKSLPIILYAQKYPHEVVRFHDLLQKARSDKELALEIVAMLEQSGVIHQSIKEGQVLLTSSIMQIKNILPDNPYRESLIDFLQGLENKLRS